MKRPTDEDAFLAAKIRHAVDALNSELRHASSEDVEVELEVGRTWVSAFEQNIPTSGYETRVTVKRVLRRIPAGG